MVPGYLENVVFLKGRRMENIKLNAGGFIGAACGAALGTAIAFVLDPDLFSAQAGKRTGSIIIAGLVACAIGGNALWSFIEEKVRKR